MKTSRVRIQQLGWALFLTASFVMQLYGGQVIVSWDQNQESDLNGYRLHYGNSSRQYQHQIDVGNVTSYTLTNLTGGRTYFFSVTAYNTAALESDYSEEVSLFIDPDDVIPPALVAIIVINDSTLMLQYSENVDYSSAENVANYQIDKNVTIYSVKLLNDSSSVKINTATHPPGNYTLTVNNVLDCSHPANMIAVDSQISYQILDTVPPDIENVVIIDSKNIDLTFTKVVDPASSQNPMNYTITEGISVVAATIDADGRTVNLSTTEHGEGNYILYANNIFDVATPPNRISENARFEYEYVDYIRPTITDVDFLNGKSLKLIFSEPVEKVSAENTTNYKINNGVVVIGAELGGDLKTVVLSTSEHSENDYQLIVNNVRDRAKNPNSILPNSRFAYQYIDVIPPTIFSVVPLAEDLVEIEFSEPVTRQTAENVANYRIEPKLSISAARLDSSHRIVLLNTAEHAENQYNLFVSNITDKAQQPNTIAPNSQWQYQYVDRIAPQIVRALAVAEDTVEVVFSEPVDAVSAQNINNYQIQPEIVIHQALLASDQITLYLATSAHSELVYNLSVNNVLDRANTPNAIAPNSTIQYQFVDVVPPAIVSVSAVAQDQVRIRFDEPINKQSAENVDHYQISDGIQVIAVQLANDTVTVNLTTSIHSEGRYTITVTNVADLAADPNILEDGAAFEYSYLDQIRPTIEMVTADDPNHVSVTFSEKVEQTSAVNIANYQINNSITIDNITLDDDEKTVHLTTSTHQPGSYIIVINNIQDRANNPNTIMANSYATYQYWDMLPPNVVDVRVLDATHVDVTFNERLEKQSAENLANYKITARLIIFTSSNPIFLTESS
ncbi:MAG: Ig-like domain-containing protein, partial [bacterium]|nr:Ig-like domain-containing protein [bacterium]